MTTRFDGRKFTFAQPDGSQIQVRGFGDQHHAVFETLDGFTLVKNPTNGFYEVARLAAACSRTRAWRPRRWSATSAPERAIPENDPAGVSDTIEIGEALTISSLAVGVSIVHSFRGDLRVTLTTPWSTVIELHPKGAGGGAKDLKTTFEASSVPALATLRGRSTRGKWRLTVQDLAPADTGRLERWSLLFTAVTDVHGPLELSEALGTPIPDAPSKGIARVLQAQTQERVGSVEVALDITHTWIGDLRVVLTSPAGTRVLLHDGGLERQPRPDLHGGHDPRSGGAVRPACGRPLAPRSGRPLRARHRQAQFLGAAHPAAGSLRQP